MFGQAVSATLLGSVNDSTGAAVPKAKVTVTQAGTGAVHETVTNESGNYTFPDLQPGTYTVTVEAAGFKKSTHQNVDVLVNSSTRMDMDLSVGAASETVMVTTAPALLQTDRADISTKIEAKQVADLPIGTNRNFQSLLNLVPGTSPATFQHSQFFNAQGALQTQANGLPRMGNVYQIEGIDDNERTGLLQIIIPPAEAIQSVDISTNNFEAELGRATGAVTNVILKSGTNKFHGSIFEFIQNNAVNARSYFGGPLGHLSYNYFGGSIGGPIWKDKLFFFGDYLRTTDHEKLSNTFSIPPPQWYTPVNGFIDLSGPLNTGTGAGQVYDPTPGNGVTTPRTAFVNNQIPIGKVNAVSLAFLQAIGKVAQPNQNVANLANPSNNYVTNLPFTKENNSFDVKMDYVMSTKDHLSGRYSFQQSNTFQAPAFGSFLGGPAGGGFEGSGTQTAYSTGLNYDHTFTSTLLTEFRIGVAHLRNNAQPTNYGSNDATTAGVPGVNIGGQPFTTGQVGIFVGNFGQSGQTYPLVGYSASVPWVRAEANIDFVNVWTKVLKNHTIKGGVDVRRVRDDLLQDQTYSPRGAFTFGENQTSNSGKPTNIANDMASFLLDVPNQTGRDLNTFFPAYRQWWFFAFVSDKWQASSKLTVDLGLRWEFYPPATPRKDGGFSNYNQVNNTLVIAGVGGNPANLGMKTQYKNFAPRTGFSYRINDSTVVRGGFGISYTSFPDNTYAYNFPIRANNSYLPVGAGQISSYTPAVLGDGTTVASFQAGFPAPVPVTIPANGIIPATTTALVGQSYNVINLNYKNPYVEAWNIAIQRALPGSMSLQLAYVANHGVAISGNQNINLPSAYGGGANSDPEYNCIGCVADPITGLTPHRTAATNLLFQGYSSNYQSLQAQLTRRFTKGLGFTSAFTWGKALGYLNGDDGGLQFFINQRRNYAPLDFDRKFNFEQSFTYELPVGRGHKYLSSGFGAYALGGWKLAGTVSLVSGLPFTVLANGGTLATPGTAQTANQVAPFKVLGGKGTGNPWFDTSAFPNITPGPNSGQPTGCTGQTYPNCTPGLGNTGRNQFRGPGYASDNLSIFKAFPIFREAALEARFEAFQLSNTPQFNNPNVGSISATNFGQITSTLGSGQGSVNGVGGGRSLQASVKISF